VPIRIVGEIDKFPTLNPNPVGFLVMDGESLLDHLNVTNIGPYVWPNEIMLRFSEQNETIDLVSYLSDKPELTGTIIDKSTIMESSDKNPLEAAGWKGAALLATGYTLLLLGLGIGSYLLYTIKKSTREIAILKALGLGVVANNSSLSLGYFSTVAMSLPLGLATGLFLSQILVPRFNNLSVKGASPYYSLNVDLSLLLIFCSVIIASVIVFVVSVLVAQNRLSIATIIRSDNEG
jgi:ABC-type antimicrobial peptide transport system permease subunit